MPPAPVAPTSNPMIPAPGGRPRPPNNSKEPQTSHSGFDTDGLRRRAPACRRVFLSEVPVKGIAAGRAGAAPSSYSKVPGSKPKEGDWRRKSCPWSRTPPESLLTRRGFKSEV